MKNHVSGLVLALAALAAGAASDAVAQSTHPLRRALHTQRKLVSEQPTDPGPLNDLGNLLFELGRGDAAEEAYRRALEIDPDFGPARFNLALLLQRQGRPKRALRHYERLLKHEPDHAWAHYQVGTELARRGKSRSASKHYAQAIRLDSTLLEPEVNPHIVANELSTRAVLLAYRHANDLSLAPHQWENPGRIARMLVPEAPAPGSATVAPAAPAEPVVVGPRPSGEPPAKKKKKRRRAKPPDGGNG